MYNIRYSSSPTCTLPVITVNGSYTGPTGPQGTDGITRNTGATGFWNVSVANAAPLIRMTFMGLPANYSNYDTYGWFQV
jgi:hypothetical protein